MQLAKLIVNSGGAAALVDYVADAQARKNRQSLCALYSFLLLLFRPLDGHVVSLTLHFSVPILILCCYFRAPCCCVRCWGIPLNDKEAKNGQNCTVAIVPLEQCKHTLCLSVRQSFWGMRGGGHCSLSSEIVMFTVAYTQTTHHAASGSLCCALTP